MVFSKTKRVLACFLSLGLFSEMLSSKVLIITHSYNRPDFIEIQEKTFKKFLQDDYEFVVFNDARDQSLRREICKTCKKLKLLCIDIPQAIHDKPYLFRLPQEEYNHACCRCANVVQYSLDILGFKHDDLAVIIDSDMFLIKPFSIRQFMQSYDLAGVSQPRGPITYIWNGLVFFNMRTLPNKETINFNCGMVEKQPCDVGGYTYWYLKNNPQVKVTYFGQSYPQNLICESCKQNSHPCKKCADSLKNWNPSFIRFLQKSPPNMEFFLHETFLHYRGGGNWDRQNPQYHAWKTKLLQGFINDILHD